MSTNKSKFFLASRISRSWSEQEIVLVC